MASAGDPFTWTPDVIPPDPLTPDLALIVTESESFKRNYLLIDPDKNELFDLDFGEIQNSGSPTGANAQEIRAHYEAQNHNYSSFYWSSVPSYIAVSPFLVRYEKFRAIPVVKDGSLWKITLTLRKEV